eukprot:g28296.t1
MGRQQTLPSPWPSASAYSGFPVPGADSPQPHSAAIAENAEHSMQHSMLARPPAPTHEERSKFVQVCMAPLTWRLAMKSANTSGYSADVFMSRPPQWMLHCMEPPIVPAQARLTTGMTAREGAVYEQNIQLAALRRRAQWQEAIGILRAMRPASLVPDIVSHNTVAAAVFVAAPVRWARALQLGLERTRREERSQSHHFQHLHQRLRGEQALVSGPPPTPRVLEAPLAPRCLQLQ